MRLYTFYDENDEVIEEVRAENHDQAVAMASEKVQFMTDFESIEAVELGE